MLKIGSRAYTSLGGLVSSNIFSFLTKGVTLESRLTSKPFSSNCLVARRYLCPSCPCLALRKSSYAILLSKWGVIISRKSLIAVFNTSFFNLNGSVGLRYLFLNPAISLPEQLVKTVGGPTLLNGNLNASTKTPFLQEIALWSVTPLSISFAHFHFAIGSRSQGCAQVVLWISKFVGIGVGYSL